MPENPLLPDDELRKLLGLVGRIRQLDAAAARRAARTSTARPALATPSREALLAALQVQMRSGDLLLPERGDGVLATLDAGALESAVAPDKTVSLPPEIKGTSSRLLLAAAMAAGLRHAGSEGVLAVLTRAGAAEPGWAEALGWARQQDLPFITVCADLRGTAAFQPASREASKTQSRFSWTAVQRVARRLQVPLLTVDGEDAVAMYRATQEAILRARAGGGPSLLWAMLPSRRDLQAGRAKAVQPLQRLRHYLQARNISV